MVNPGDLFSCLHQSVQAFAAHSSRAAIPPGGAAGQNALNSATVEVAEDLK